MPIVARWDYAASVRGLGNDSVPAALRAVLIQPADTAWLG
jgi:hypothetical protein